MRIGRLNGSGGLPLKWMLEDLSWTEQLSSIQLEIELRIEKSEQ
jgi:hypothetical protein